MDGRLVSMKWTRDCCSTHAFGCLEWMVLK